MISIVKRLHISDYERSSFATLCIGSKESDSDASTVLD